ncbi:MAG TPA: helix-turn-helix transcriptional regulator [bacterium]|nr:helix-turn-helix transcriptional regulator [bacterium]
MTTRTKEQKGLNKLKEYRENKLISKTELARNAEISLVTLDRIEKGYACRMATKRKILEALGMDIAETGDIFSGDDR